MGQSSAAVLDSLFVADINNLLARRVTLRKELRKYVYNPFLCGKRYNELSIELTETEAAIRQKILEKFPNVKGTDIKRGLVRRKLRTI
ncbi:MAG: hypothetical protein QME63_05305 [Actinomycetota bacterium]|nr:hypothetical protein [Actinomycetota bacterium]